MDTDCEESPASYTYEPLGTEKQQIRLLKIIQGDSSPIHCTVNVFDMDNLPPYSALSYTWGDPGGGFEILLDGQPFPVRSNLFHFLETFRRECNDTYLWIDQICISQSNVKERNHQVALMSRIYSRCKSTILWLCDDDDNGLYAAYAADFNVTGKSGSLAPLVADAYFTRLWVVQEVLLSPHVQVFVSGNVWVSWAAMQRCFETKGWKPTPAKALVLPTFGRRTGAPDLSWYIRRFSGNGCEDARDKVYGLQGLVHRTKRVDVDYNKCVFDVFVDAVLVCHVNKHFDILWHLGEDMGIETADIVSLDAFLALLLPRTLVSDSDDISLVSCIVSSILPDRAKNPEKKPQRGKRKRPARDPDLEPKFWYPSMSVDHEDAFLNPRKSHPARNQCHRFRFAVEKFTSGPFFNTGWDIVQDTIDGGSPASHVEAQNERLVRYRQRVSTRARPPYRLQEYSLEWSFRRHGKQYNYTCAPNWEAILRLDTALMRSIVERLRGAGH